MTEILIGLLMLIGILSFLLAAGFLLDRLDECFDWKVIDDPIDGAVTVLLTILIIAGVLAISFALGELVLHG